MIASKVNTQTTSNRHDLPDEILAVIDTAEFEAARTDPRVRSFLTEADAYLAELEQQGRNR
jgi:anti-sigma factor ChrR (cupin superfamily)